MMTKLIFAFSIIVAGAATTGCVTREDSCNIKTDGVYVVYEITEQNGKATARATFFTGDDANGTNLVLNQGNCGDQISVNGHTLGKKSGSSVVNTHYEALLDTADTYEFVFERENESPYISEVSNLPAPVSIIHPSGEDINRNVQFDVTWDNNDEGKINLLIASDCFWDYPDTLGKAITDNGQHTVPAEAFDVKSGYKSETCTATVEMERSVEGTLDPDLKGTITGKTRDTSSFNTLPNKAR